MEEKLINKNYGDKFNDHLLEQYKIFVESVNNISSKRDSANYFYLTINSTLFTIISYLSSLEINIVMSALLPIIGILISFSWIKIINSYKNLSEGKFKVIHELENYLPASLFKYEWHILINKVKYHPITNTEKTIPKIFILFYILLFIFIIIYKF